jgi:hypothetical protein
MVVMTARYAEAGLLIKKYQSQVARLDCCREQIPRAEKIESLLYCDSNFAKRCSRWQMTTVGRNAAFPGAFQSKGDASVCFRPKAQKVQGRLKIEPREVSMGMVVSWSDRWVERVRNANAMPR